MRAYLDHNATSPLKPEAKAAMLAALERGGNASSIHAEGRGARATIEAARDGLARELGVIAPMVIFTSGGTEANNLALKGAGVDRFILSAVEHPCIREAARATGKPVDVVPVDGEGRLDLAALAACAQKPGRALVALMLANNETGVILPVREAAGITRPHGHWLHVDGVQGLGKLPLRFAVLGADSLALSAHKIGGPLGAGALVIADGLPLSPQMDGGGQELRRRAGTENAPALAGFAAALGPLPAHVAGLRDRMEAELAAQFPDIRFFGRNAPRLPNTSCFALPGLAADTALISLDLDGVSVSSGSACSSGKVGQSHVLAAMGVAETEAKAAIRVSLGWNSTVSDIEQFMAALSRAAARTKRKVA